MGLFRPFKPFHKNIRCRLYSIYGEIAGALPGVCSIEVRGRDSSPSVTFLVWSWPRDGWPPVKAAAVPPGAFHRAYSILQAVCASRGRPGAAGSRRGPCEDTPGDCYRQTYSTLPALAGYETHQFLIRGSPGSLPITYTHQ